MTNRRSPTRLTLSLLVIHSLYFRFGFRRIAAMKNSPISMAVGAMRYYPLDMDSEAKVSGLAKKVENFPGSFQLLESMTQDFLLRLDALFGLALSRSPLISPIRWQARADGSELQIDVGARAPSIRRGFGCDGGDTIATTETH